MDQSLDVRHSSSSKSTIHRGAASRRLGFAVLAALTMVMRDETLLRKLDEASIEHLAECAKILLPENQDVQWIHPLLMLRAGFLDRAQALACGDFHPMSKAVMAWCAYLSGDERWHVMARDVIKSGNHEASRMARIMLDGHPDASQDIVSRTEQGASQDFLQFYFRC